MKMSVIQNAANDATATIDRMIDKNGNSPYLKAIKKKIDAVVTVGHQNMQTSWDVTEACRAFLECANRTCSAQALNAALAEILHVHNKTQPPTTIPSTLFEPLKPPEDVNVRQAAAGASPNTLATANTTRPTEPAQPQPSAPDEVPEELQAA